MRAIRWGVVGTIVALASGCSKPHDGATDGAVGDGAPSASYDVVVVGAGTGGTSAAIAAARHGVQVLLVEPTGWVGGQMASVPEIEDARPGYATDTGFAQELSDAITAHYAALQKSVHTCGLPGAIPMVCAEPHVVRDQLVAMLATAGVTLRLHTDVTAVAMTGSAVSGVTLSDGTTVAAHVVIDATELGDVLPLTGAAYRVGKPLADGSIDPTACVQAITQVAPIRKYASVPTGYTIASAPADYDQVPTGAYFATPGYATTLHAAFIAAVQANPPPPMPPASTPYSWSEDVMYRGVPDSTNPTSYDSSEPTLITRTSINFANDYPLELAGTLPMSYIEDRGARIAFECEAARETLAFVYYAQHELGGEHGELWSLSDDEGFAEAGGFDASACPDLPPELATLAVHMPPHPYARESRRIVSLRDLTGADLHRATPNATAMAFHSAIARGWYDMDLHGCTTSTDLDLGDTPSPMTDGNSGMFEVPLESLIPITVDGLLAAEKNIGVSRLANGATRLEGVTMLTGEAAGVLAALAVQGAVQPRAIAPFDVQQALVADHDGLSLVEYDDVLPTDPSWAAVQLVATRGLMVGAGTTFSLTGPIDREQAAAPLAKVFGLVTGTPATCTSSMFSDVPISDGFCPYVAAIASAGLTSGCGAGMFCPLASLTRTQLAVMLTKGLGVTASTCGSSFGDVTAGTAGCAEITYATAHGLIADCGGGNFCPGVAVTRDTMAASLVAVMKTIGAPL